MKLTTKQKQQIEQAGAKIRSSRQPKNNPAKDKPSADNFFASVYRWVKKAEKEQPPYVPDSRELDSWLRMIYKEEPHLSGVVSTAVSLDQNRGFKLVGGRNQVVRFSKVFSELDNGLGWREHKAMGSQDYYVCNQGQVVEVETLGKNGPLTSLYHVDATKTFNINTQQIEYNGKVWQPDWFYKICSMPSPDEKFNRLGYSAVFRCLKIAQIMIAVIQHDLEKLGTLAPRGLLLLESENLTGDMWDSAMEQHEQVTIGKTGNEYFDNIIVLVDRQIKGNLLPFSSLPDNFDVFQFTDYMMKAYALCFNRDVRAFWSVNSGSFGGGREAELQYERATYGGIVDYAKSDQEAIQRLLPPTLLFQYEVDDTNGKMLKAQLSQAWVDVGLSMKNLGLSEEAVLSMLVKEQIIDPDWTEQIEEEVITDDDTTMRFVRQELLQYDHVQRAVERYQDDPIVAWDGYKFKTIWQTGRSAIKPYWRGTDTKRKPERRDRAFIQRAVNTSGFHELVDKAKKREIEKDQFRTQLDNYMRGATLLEFMYQFTDNKPTRSDTAAIRQLSGVVSSLGVESVNESLLPAIPVSAWTELNKMRDGVQDSTFDDWLYNDDIEDTAEESVDSRSEMWLNTIASAGFLGQIYLRGGDNDLLSWRVGSGNSCPDCSKMDGVTKTRSEWQSGGLYPRCSGLACGGYRCKCGLV